MFYNNSIIIIVYFKLLIFLVILVFFNSCYKEENVFSEDILTLNFYMTIDQENSIYSARGKKFEIDNPKPVLDFNNSEYKLNKFSLRGHTALNYKRKSYSVSIEIPLTLYNTNINRNAYSLREFKLLALATDYTYIENRISFGLLNLLDIQPLFFKFVEVRINNNTQGIYLLIEDPEEYVIDKKGCDYILRRDYYGIISNSEYFPYNYEYSEEEYKNQFNSLYNYIVQFEGKELYDSLNKYLDLNNYFQKMAFDYLIMNGDYTDEIYFYAINRENNIYYDIIPWDYDDIFADLPHEIGKEWGTGKKFGERRYNSLNDVYADIGNKLIFSIEEDIDYKIAKDTFLYVKYIEQLKKVLDITNNNNIDKVFNETLSELTPYYNNEIIIEQSKYDLDVTNYNIFLNNINEKREFLKNRRNEIIKEISK